ncbi:MAG: type II toxin-antitoxin system RelE/ParE family toxin [Cyanobacteria bacterium J06621_11]
MSGPQLPLKILPKAATDIKQILKYTQRVWGDEQRKKYKGAIDQCLKDIQANPAPRITSENCSDGYLRRHLNKKYRHYVFYKVTSESILIVRLLHDSMDSASHLD